MTTIEITKRKVIKALESEPARTLRPGKWVSAPMDREETAKVSDPNCTVCAVGAVMRCALDPDEYATKADEVAMDATEAAEMIALAGTRGSILAEAAALAKDYPMNALSCVFEGLASLSRKKSRVHELSNRQIAGIRRSVVAFAKKHLPAKMHIHIGNAKPAHDVKVVR
jgi:hypothetical protein